MNILWYLYVSWLLLVCSRLSLVLSAGWIHGLVFGANWYHTSVWCTLMSNTHMDVILWSVCYFGAYCISYYIALLTGPALAISSKCTWIFHAALNKRKYLLSLSLSVFIIAQQLLLRLHFRGCPTSLDWLFHGVFQVYESLTLLFSCGADLMASFNNDKNFNHIS